MTRSTALMLGLLTAVLLSGCDTTEETRPPAASLTIVNAAPGFENLSIRRGTSNFAELGVLQYAGRQSVSIDSGTYNYTVETRDSLSPSLIERATFTDEVEAGQKHLYVLAEQNDAVVPMLFSRPEFDQSSAEWDLTVVNAAESVASPDVYVLPAGSGIGSVAAIGPAQFGQMIAGGTRAPGAYEFVLTEPGNPGSVLFTSEAIEFVAGGSVELVIAADTNGVENRLTLLGTIGGSVFTLGDTAAPSAVRFVNGAADQLPRDVFLDGDFATPFAGNIEFAVVGDFAELPAGTSQVSVTPLGNASVVETELVDALSAGALHDILISGMAGDISSLAVIDNRLRNNSRARLLFLNTASTYENLNVYVVEPGTDITAVTANVVLGTPGASTRQLIEAQTFELTVTDPVSGNVVLGPLSLTVAEGGLYTVVLHDSGDGTTVSALLLDDFL
ncbi:MAG: hypothetical protein PVF50_08840 [Gammaproteobacteria bacterium]